MVLPQRKPVRLPTYDYSSEGAYFITICTHDRQCILGDIQGSQMYLSQAGLITEKNLHILDGLHPELSLDKFTIMPNHLHLLLFICRERIVCAPPSSRAKSLLSKAIQSLKSSITKEIRSQQLYPASRAIWQTGFHDHIIRNQSSYLKIWNYIDTNPYKWQEDCHHPSSPTPW